MRCPLKELHKASTYSTCAHNTCIFACTHAHLHICQCIFSYLRSYNMHINACTQTSMSMYTTIHACMHTNTQTYTYTHANMHAFIHSYTLYSRTHNIWILDCMRRPTWIQHKVYINTYCTLI